MFPKLLTFTALVPLVVLLWMAILKNWRIGIYGAFIYMPLGGFFTFRSGSNPALVLAKDLLFIIPSYIAVALIPRERRLTADLSKYLMVPILGLVLLVIYGVINPLGQPLVVGLIGAKVWLFYIPLLFLGLIMFSDAEDLLKFLKLLLLVGLVPVIFGLAIYISSTVIGWERTVSMVYGDGALDSKNQAFRVTNIGPSIMSTFSFRTQYVGFVGLMLCFTYIGFFCSTSKIWKYASALFFALFSLAFLFSGSRAGFVMIPLIIMILFFARYGFVGLITGFLLGAVIFISAPIVLGIDLGEIVNLTLLRLYGSTFGWLSHVFSYIIEYPLGAGTGTATIPAITYGKRILGPDAVQLMTFPENLYLSCLFEFGIIGLLLLVWMMIYFIYSAYVLSKIGVTNLQRNFGIAFTAFFILVAIANLGQGISIEPYNLYFWFFAGVVEHLKRQALREREGTVAS